MAKSWKSVERRIAKRLGTNRTPLSGENSRHTGSDTLHPNLFVEVKSWEDPSLHDEFMDLRRKARYRDKKAMILLEENAEDPMFLLITDFDEALEQDEPRSESLLDFSSSFLLKHICKAQSPYYDLMEKSRKRARSEGKRPVLAISKNRSSVILGITGMDWWRQSWRWERLDAGEESKDSGG